MTAITNIVIALAISTTKWGNVPCPDNIAGCCVLHQAAITETTYEPLKLTTENFTTTKKNSKDIGFCLCIEPSSLEQFKDAIAKHCGKDETKWQDIIPVRALNDTGGPEIADHPVMVIITKELLKSLALRRVKEQYPKCYINWEEVRKELFK